ncbi:AAA family ATPase [Laspinema olomoucense]|uniref:AAA family ATPase n=1 Tax=Laspinema olomoucense TaxID=3231600 RepID=UPI0021BAEF1F|nr:AAA family ATPase [Laspinema sp. D3a]MCT7990988.1 AAA family ATPase [Laspinema sp. D3a]
MNGFEKIEIYGFRRLRSVQVEMRPLTVIIGANGVGKTSFLEMFSLLSESAKGQLQSKISEFGGLGDILTRDQADSFRVVPSVFLEKYGQFNYFLKLDIKGQQFYEIEQESLTRSPLVFTYINSSGLNVQYFANNNQVPVRPNWEHNPLETSLSQVPKMYQEAEAVRKQLASCSFYRAWELNLSPTSPVRLPQAMRPATLPGNRGEDLVSCLYNLRETDPDRFELISDTLSAAFPSFERLSFPPVAAGTLALTWKEKNFSHPLYMHQLSEGTVRFLWLVTLLQSPNLTAVTLIDEPEVSLHPELLRLLVDVMREASKRTQLIVATHSDRLIRFLQPDEVLVCDADEEGFTTMTWADSLDLEKWLEEYSLDELWAMNIIGGRS